MLCYYAIRLKWKEMLSFMWNFILINGLHTLLECFTAFQFHISGHTCLLCLQQYKVFILWITLKCLGDVQGVFIYYFIPCPTGKLQRAFKLEVGMFVEAWDWQTARCSSSLISSFFGIYLLLSCLKGKRYLNEAHKDKWLFQAVINFTSWL